MLNERKCKALVDISAPGLVVDDVFVVFSCEFCNNAELTGVTNRKCGAHAEVKTSELKVKQCD